MPTKTPVAVGVPRDAAREARAGSNGGSAGSVDRLVLLLVDEVGHLRGVYNDTLAHEVNRLVEDEGLKAKGKG